MQFGKLSGRARLLIKRFFTRLWVKPLLVSVVSVGGVFAAKWADQTALTEIAPEITVESIQTLLSIMASSVLVIATLAVASMVSAYASASNTASPRAFPLVVADDRTQYALSVFVGTFIYSIVGLIASKNEYFGPAGRFVLFSMTLFVLAIIVLTFVTWVDRIARLGRMSATIEQVELAAAKAMRARRKTPFLGGHPLSAPSPHGRALYADDVGFLQHIDMSALQEDAVKANLRFEIIALPGTLITPDREIARCVSAAPFDANGLQRMVQKHFVIGRNRTFEGDPRFGLVVLSQIAGRALSPAVNDPGTAIDVIGAFVRLFVDWNTPRATDEDHAVTYDRVTVPRLHTDDMFDDAFSAIERDGAATVEVMVRLLRALEAFARVGDKAMRAAALRHAARVVALVAEESFLPADRALIAERAAFS